MTGWPGVVVLVLCLGCCIGQSCEDWAGSPPGCASVIGPGSLIFVSKDSNQGTVSAAISDDVALLSNASLPANCSSPTLGIICTQAFPPCFTDKETNVVFGQPSCRMVCDSIGPECAQLLQNLALSTPDCLALDAGTPVFPEWDEPLVLLGADGLIAIPCVTQTASDSSSCPPHFSLADDGGCHRSCPYETWTEGEYLGLYVTSAVLGSVGLLVSCCTLAPKALDSSQRRFPRSISTIVFMIAIATCFMLVWPVFFGYENVVCEDAATLADSGTTKCVIYGAAMYWFSLSTMYWWLILLLLKIVFMTNLVHFSRKEKQLLYWGSFTGGAVIPTAAMVYTLSNSVFTGLSESGFACFVDPDKDDGWWLAGTFFIPMGFMLLFGLVLMLVAYPLSLCAGSAGNLAAAPDEAAKSFISAAKKEWRLHLFLAYQVFVWIQLIAYYVVVRALKDDIDTGRDDWYQCLEQTGSSVACNLEDQMPYGITAYVHVLAVTFPLSIVLLFGCTLSTYRFYKNAFWGLVRFRVLVLSGQRYAIKAKRAKVYRCRRAVNAAERRNENEDAPVVAAPIESGRLDVVKRVPRKALDGIKHMLLFEFGAQTRPPKGMVNFDDFGDTFASERSRTGSTNSSESEGIELDEVKGLFLEQRAMSSEEDS